MAGWSGSPKHTATKTGKPGGVAVAPRSFVASSGAMEKKVTPMASKNKGAKK